MTDKDDLGSLPQQATVQVKGIQAGASAAIPLKAGARFDHLMVDLLTQHKGVFLGEIHDQPALVQSVTHLLPSLKSAGLATLSLELPQQDIDAISVNQSYEEYANLSGNRWMRDDFKLVQSAKRLGIKVLGHESGAATAEVRAVFDRVFALKIEGKIREADAVEKAAIKKWTNIAALSVRDAWAAHFIDANKTGKALVIGGQAHSGKYRRSDAEGATPADHALKGDYEGLDIRLGFPSIDFRNANEVSEIGTTMDGGKFSSFTVRLPPDLQKQGITSWPPSSPHSRPIFNRFEPFKNLIRFPGTQPPQPAHKSGPAEQRPKPGSGLVSPASRASD